jgi:integrase
MATCYGILVMITEEAISAAIINVANRSRGRVELAETTAIAGQLFVFVVHRWPNRVACEWRLRCGGQSRRIGVYPELGLEDARAVARSVRGQAGITKAPDETRVVPTVTAIFEVYVAHLAEANKPGAYGARRLLLGTNGAAEALGPNRLASEVDVHDVRAFLGRIYERGTIVQANNAHVWIRAAYNYAKKGAYSYTERCPLLWNIDANPAALIPTNMAAFRPGVRVLREDELINLWNWLDGVKTKRQRLIASAIRLLILTGQRPSEILQLTRANYLDYQGVLEWTKTKNGCPHAIPLPQLAGDVLEELECNRYGLFFPRLYYEDQWMRPYHLGNMLHRFTKATGTDPLTPRDLRRTWKTLAGAAGVPKEIRDRMQNHAIRDVSARNYDRYSYWREKCEAMWRWNSYVAHVLGSVSATARITDAGTRPLISFRGGLLLPNP